MEKIPKGDPLVMSLPSEANHVSKSATVTLRGRTKSECKASISHDSTGTTSILDFDEDFLGLTELANRCVNDEKHYFEYVIPAEYNCLKYRGGGGVFKQSLAFDSCHVSFQQLRILLFGLRE